jgi:hypothetical protein
VQANLRTVLLCCAACSCALQYDAARGDEANPNGLAKQLANPVAALISVPLQLNWDTGLAANGLGEKYQLNIQPVIPIELNAKWNVISRTIIPLTAQSDIVPGDPHQSGLGDITQSLFLTSKEPIGGHWIIGAGPALLIPTATDPALGFGKWGIGPTVVALTQTPSNWTYGLLWNHIWSVAGQSHRPAVNSTFLQPFISKGLGNGLTVGATIESSYNWEGHNWVVPLNVTVTQVMKIGSQLVSVGGGARYYLDKPAGGPDWGLRLMVTLLYPQ